MTKRNGWMILVALLSVGLLLGSCSARSSGSSEEPGPAGPAAATEGPGPVESGKQVVAKINGVSIYLSDLNLGVARYQQQLTATGQEPDLEREAEHRVATLEFLVENELLYQEATRRGFAADALEVDDQLKAIASQFPGQQKFEEALAQMGLTREDLRKDLERAQVVQRMIEDSIAPGISIRPEEVRAYYDGNPELFLDPERIRARHILIKITEGATEATRAEARRTLEQLRRRARKGEAFEDLAREFSQDPMAADGGDLGYLTRGVMIKEFEEAAFALQPGEISGVVATLFGYHLIQVVDRQAPQEVPFAQVEVSLTRFLHSQRVDQTVQSLADELRRKAEIRMYDLPA